MAGPIDRVLVTHQADICFTWDEAINYAHFIAWRGMTRSKPFVKREERSQLWSVTWEPH
jgi:hypothetical protein